MWFDSSNFANLAKNALKEAQKHIDSVLDISEDEVVELHADDAKMSRSKTDSSIPDIGKSKTQGTAWGSFNGSFFEQKAPSTPITNPPPKKTSISSESLEVLSSQTTTSPSPDDLDSSRSTMHGSIDDSVEIIHKTPSVVDVSCGDNESNLTSTADEISLTSPDEVPSIPIQARNLSQEIDTSTTLTNSDTSSFYDATKESLDQTLKSVSSFMDKSMESFEIQTQVSDSTHSFEEIQHPSRSPKLESHEELKSEEVKDGSGQTSGDDEMETTTSSDIEIISSPNCDSSSTNSCNKISPKSEFPYQNSESCLAELKLGRMKQHSRELSEISVLSLASDDSPGSLSENEKLNKRISELSETLEQREYKMMQLGRNNAELFDANLKLTQQLEEIKKNRNTLDMTNVQEEYTQRLSALEKKFQQSIRDNALLKKQADAMKTEMETKVSREEYERVICEKDYLIDELKSEGEKLSKQILTHSNIIKKLRTKLKESDDKLKKQDVQLTEFSEENQKLKKTLTAKDEIEKSQTEGINKLTTEKRKIDKENQHLKSEIEDFKQKLQLLQTSHETLKNELDKKNADILQSLEDDKEKALNESSGMKKELTDLRIKIRDVETFATTQEQKLRQENIILKQKLEETEFRIEDQKQEASLASIPLIRQLESLQSTFNVRKKQWENQEKQLLEKLDTAQNQLKYQSDGDKAAKDQMTQMNLKINNLEENLSKTCRKLEQTAGNMQQKEIEYQLHENDYKLKIDQLTMELSERSREFDNFRQLIAELETKLTLKTDEVEEEKKKTQFLQQQERYHERQDSRDHELGNISPVPSIESLRSHPWNVDDMDNSANYSSSHYGGVVQSSAPLMEGLQSILKQRDGEVQQLQFEIHRLQTERNFLSSEITNLNIDLEKASEQISNNLEIQAKQAEMQVQYDALLEMFGQKVEEYEELKLDLVDLRSILQIQKKELEKL